MKESQVSCQIINTIYHISRFKDSITAFTKRPSICIRNDDESPNGSIDDSSSKEIDKDRPQSVEAAHKRLADLYNKRGKGKPVDNHVS